MFFKGCSSLYIVFHLDAHVIHETCTMRLNRVKGARWIQWKKKMDRFSRFRVSLSDANEGLFLWIREKRVQRAHFMKNKTKLKNTVVYFEVSHIQYPH